MSMKRSKSLNSLKNNAIHADKDYNWTVNESSAEVHILNDTLESDDVVEDRNMMADSGIEDKKVSDCEMLLCMERKIDKLSDMFLEQCRLLTKLKEEIRNSKLTMEKTEQTHSQIFADLLKKAITQRMKELNLTDIPNTSDGNVLKSRASALLNTLEAKEAVTLNKEVTDAFVNFLQSEELKEQMVNATAQSVRDVIGTCLPRDFSNIYLPILERSHRRLVRHITQVVEEGFTELEQNSACLSKSVFKTSKILHRALERHQSILEAAADPGKNIINTLQCTVEELLHNELKEWRQKVIKMFCEQLQSERLEKCEQRSMLSDNVLKVPPQPTEPGYSIFDQLMVSAHLRKQINEGDINNAFERALSASDLSLVVFTCRSVEPTVVFTQPCKLKQHVLLSLVQQLSTDMMHDTQLKCRYLEDAIIHLNTAHPDTRAHLPLVIGEVHKHLKKFISSCPNHTVNRRITLIIMAANNLLK